MFTIATPLWAPREVKESGDVVLRGRQAWDEGCAHHGASLGKKGGQHPVVGGEGFVQREVSLASGGLCSLGLPHHDAG